MALGTAASHEGSDLRAVTRGELVVHYRPIVALDTGRRPRPRHRLIVDRA